MVLIDTHAHLTYENLNQNYATLLKDWQDNNVKIIFTVGYNLESSKHSLEIANSYPNIYAVIGVHPSDIDCLNQDTLNWLEQNAKNDKVVAIGEIGLDYHYPNINKENQINGFIKQLQLAHKVGLPVVIHTRDCKDDILNILKQNKHLLSNGGVVHCFSEDYEFFKEIESLGLSISIGGVITFNNAKNLQNTIKQIPLSKIMLETDAPYLTPMPFRGKVKNNSKFIPLIAQKLAQLKEVTLEEVANQTTKNVYNLFKKVKEV